MAGYLALLADLAVDDRRGDQRFVKYYRQLAAAIGRILRAVRLVVAGERGEYAPAVGIEPEVQVEWRRLDLKPGDYYLLCTDGLYDMVSGSGIRRAFASGGKCSDIVGRLRDMIVARGAVDNFTMVVLKIKG